MMLEYLYGFVGSFLVAFPAFLKHKLSRSGLLGALLLGTLIYGFGTFLLWVTLIAFFLSSTLISRKHQRKSERHGRTIIQVFANGGIALVCAFFYAWTSEENWLVIALISFAGSNADTWGSEIGTAIGGKTFYITNFQPVTPGLSGGISIEGTLASAFGSIFIAVIVLLFQGMSGLTPMISLLPWQLFLLITGMGFLNTILDSYFGALLQAKYQGMKQAQIYETKEKNTRLVAGFTWMNNDGVNALSTFVTAVITAFFLAL